MWSIQGRPRSGLCDGSTRREILRVGGLGAFGVPLTALLGGHSAAAAAKPARGFGQARSCLLIYLFGGPSQLDTFDPKPDAPERFRGEFRPIATSVPGTIVCEHLPRLATLTHRYALIRSMTHEHPRHGWGLYYMLTGRKHNRPDLDAPPSPEDFPGVGALVSKLAPGRPDVPPAITLPRWNRFNDLPNDYAGERAGFLGPAYHPWLVRGGAGGQAFSLMGESLDLSIDDAPGRLVERRDLLHLVEKSLGRWSEQERAQDSLLDQAARLLTSPRVRAAFRIDQESARLRDEYGKHPFGQGLLLSRRLIEAGARLVQLNWHDDGSDVKSPFWDTHKDNFNTLKTKLLPPVDQALATFLQDAAARGLLDETLVVVMGEFGRTPRIGQVVMNAATDRAGRDHWPHAYTVLVAGAGVRGGLVHGVTDDRAAYVTRDAVSPPDLHATILHALGIDPDTRFLDRRGRSYPASLGRPVLELFA